MTESSQETWHSRDLPFLTAIVAQLELTPDTSVSAASIARNLSIDDTTTLRILKNLIRGEYVLEIPGAPRRGGDTVLDHQIDVTEKALHAVGVWPTPETALDRIIAALEAIAENTDDEDERTRARKILDGFAGAGRQLGIAVAGAAISGQIPGV